MEIITSRRVPVEGLIGLVLVVIIALVYGQVGSFDFSQYDDGLYVAGNRHVLSGLTWSNACWAFTTLDAGFWHPLTWLSLMLDGELHGPGAGGYHWTNVFFHIGSTLLLLRVFVRMTDALWRSALVAALFALHPLHVESVVWVAERKDVLSTFFWMWTMLAYIRYVEHRTWQRYGALLILFVLGLMAKPMLVTLPFVLLLCDYWPLGRMQRKGIILASNAGALAAAAGANPTRNRKLLWLVGEKVPLLLVALSSIGLTFYAEIAIGALATTGALPWDARLANAIVSCIAYIAKMFWPVHLAVFYPHPGYWPWLSVVASAIILAGLTAGAILSWKRFPAVMVGWFWYLATLLPVSGIVQIGAHAMADRYTYVPLIGLFLVLAWSLPGSVKGVWRLGVPVAVSIVLAVLSVAAWRQVGYWQSDLTLFRHAIAVTEGNYVAENNLAGALMKAGDSVGAMNHFQQAVAIKPNYEPAYFGMGILLQKGHRKEDAILCYRQTLAIEPRFVDAHIQLGAIFLQQHRIDEAIVHYLRAVHLAPERAALRNFLGIALSRKNARAEAAAAFREALQLEPCHAGIHNNLAMVLLEDGRMDEAIAHFREALAVEPQYANAHFNLALALEKKGREGEAEQHRQKAREINPAYGMKNERIRRE